MTEYVYLNGDYVDIAKASIPVRTHAFLYGTAVFEGIRAYWNEEEKQLYAFRVPEHYERLIRSAKIMHMLIIRQRNGLPHRFFMSISPCIYICNLCDLFVRIPRIFIPGNLFPFCQRNVQIKICRISPFRSMPRVISEPSKGCSRI